MRRFLTNHLEMSQTCGAVVGSRELIGLYIIIQLWNSLYPIHSYKHGIFYLNWKRFFCHKLGFSNPKISATNVLDLWYFKTMNCVWLNNLSLKYPKFSSFGYKYIKIRRFKFVTTFFYIFSWFIRGFFMLSQIIHFCANLNHF